MGFLLLYKILKEMGRRPLPLARHLATRLPCKNRLKIYLVLAFANPEVLPVGGKELRLAAPDLLQIRIRGSF